MGHDAENPNVGRRLILDQGDRRWVILYIPPPTAVNIGSGNIVVILDSVFHRNACPRGNNTLVACAHHLPHHNTAVMSEVALT